MRNSSNSMILVAVFLFLFMSTTSVNAKSGQLYEVGTEDLHVRTSPDINAEIVGKLKFGDRVTAFKEHHGWISTYYDGKEVWVASHYLFKSEEDGVNKQQTDNTSQTITIIADSVHLRNGPSTDYAIVGHVSKGDTYDFVETSNDWHKVKLDNGSTGWIASRLTNYTTGSKATSRSSDESSTNSSTKKTPANVASESSKPLAGYNIILDPGHGGIDPGALSIHAEKEKVLTLDFSKVIAEKLRNEGATVLLTRSTDSYVSLEDRVRISGSYLTDAFISIHFNAFTSTASNGISTHYYANGADHELAQHVQTALEKNTNLRSRGVRQGNYYVLRENSDLAILVELGFITNPHDLEVIRNSSYSAEVAEAISEGLTGYFNK